MPNGMSHSPEPDVPLQPHAGSMVLATAPQAAQAPAPQEGQDTEIIQRQQALSNYIKSATEDFGAVSSYPTLHITSRQLVLLDQGHLMPSLLLGLDKHGLRQALLGGFQVNGSDTTAACASGGAKPGESPFVCRP